MINRLKILDHLKRTQSFELGGQSPQPHNVHCKENKEGYYVANIECHCFKKKAFYKFNCIICTFFFEVDNNMLQIMNSKPCVVVYIT